LKNAAFPVVVIQTEWEDWVVQSFILILAGGSKVCMSLNNLYLFIYCLFSKNKNQITVALSVPEIPLFEFRAGHWLS
jgi:hypothetical protein